MAKQQKKTVARRVPRASEPRMYGDGKSSQPAEAEQTRVAGHAVAERPVVTATPTRLPAPGAPAVRTPAARAAGVTPRGAGASGSYGRIDRITDYSYVKADLRRLGVVAAGILAVLVVLGIVLP